MPREGTKSLLYFLATVPAPFIEIRYAPGGDEKLLSVVKLIPVSSIEIRYAPGGDEKEF